MACSKYDRKYDFNVILRQVVPCRKLRRICRKHSNDVVRQVEHQISEQLLSRDIILMSRKGLQSTITVKHLDTEKDAFLVSLPVKYC